jgi:hypothetical protein
VVGGGLVAVLACASEGGTGHRDAETGAEPACAALDYEVALALEEADLPARADLKHTMQGAGVGDLDGDGWLDAFISWAGGSFLMMNDGAGDLVPTQPLTTAGDALSPGIAVALADLDDDGDLDAWLGRWGAADELLWNDGTGTFTAESVPGTEGATYSVAFADADGDGDLDAYVSAAHAEMQYDLIVQGEQVGDPNLLLLQDADHHFAEAQGALPEDTRYGMTLHTAWVDADGDGDLDLYVGNDAGPYIDRNHLLLNDGAGRFADAPECGCDLAIFSMGVAVGDADDDGLPDLYVTNVAAPALLVNLGDGTFADAALAMGAQIPALPESMVSWGTAFADLDADRDQDLVVTFGQSSQNFEASGIPYEDGEEQPDQILLSDGGAGYSRAAVPGFSDPGRSRAVALGDFDRDGRQDMVIVGKYFLKHWRATGGCDPGVTVRFAGARTIGARIDATVGDRTRTSWFLPSTSGSSSAPEVYVGFGGRGVGDLVVTPPGGEPVEYSGLEAGGTVVVGD